MSNVVLTKEKIVLDILQNKISNLSNDFVIKLILTNLISRLENLIVGIYKKLGKIVVLIDDYDREIFRNKIIDDVLYELESFYNVLIRNDKYIKFFMVTGQLKINETGLYNALNSLQDISDSKKFGAITGFTQEELEDSLGEWISFTASEMNIAPSSLLDKIRKKYGGYCFDGKTMVYNPHAVLTCLWSQKLVDCPSKVKKSTEIKANNQKLLHTPNYSIINPGDKSFLKNRNNEIYVDKTGLLIYTNTVIDKDDKYICFSKPRRFGKTFLANMIAAYCDLEGKAKESFAELKISKHDSFNSFANKYIVIKLNIRKYLSRDRDDNEFIFNIKNNIVTRLAEKYKISSEFDDVNTIMQRVHDKTKLQFVIVIDEWDCLFRVFKNKIDLQEQYIDFLESWLKDWDYIALVYMTGILPIKKYGIH
ncbi:MAG: AAA family ATPase [Desulfovibrionaceae bacterium]|nr:AAA family ATPase [Desulfovibrionaceae bacterium]